MNLSFIIRCTFGDEIETLPYVPPHIKYEKLAGAACAYVHGPWGYIILQLIKLAGVDIWDTQYNIFRRIALECGINNPFIEFHNAVVNYNPTEWKLSERQYNTAGFGGISAGPFIHNKVVFEPGVYRTTDFHCEKDFLIPFAEAFPKIDTMMDTFAGGKHFAQVETPVRHKGIPGALLHQLLNVKVREPLLPMHYYGKVTEFFSRAFEVMDPSPIILPTTAKRDHAEKAKEVAAIIKAECEKPLTLPGLAKRVAINVSYLACAFNEVYKVSVMRYVLLTRIEKVKEYLLDTSFDLETIADRTQFCDSAHLSNQFKSITGQTPTEFRSYWLN